MTSGKAKKYGRSKILTLTGIAIVLWVIVFFFQETRGDFGNGILFFFEDIANPHLAIIILILFTVTAFFGGKAGKEIIILKKYFAWVALKYSVFIVVTIVLCTAIVGIAKDGNLSFYSLPRLLMTNFLNPLIRTGIIYLVPIFIIWLIATNQMRTALDRKIGYTE